MRRLLIGIIGLSWALAAQPQGIDLSGLKFGGSRLSKLFCDPAAPRDIGYGGLSDRCEDSFREGMQLVDVAFRRVELMNKDDRRVAEIEEEQRRAEQRLRTDRQWQGMLLMKRQMQFDAWSRPQSTERVPHWLSLKKTYAPSERLAKERTRMTEQTARMVTEYWEQERRRNRELPPEARFLEELELPYTQE